FVFFFFVVFFRRPLSSPSRPAPLNAASPGLIKTFFAYKSHHNLAPAGQASPLVSPSLDPPFLPFTHTLSLSLSYPVLSSQPSSASAHAPASSLSCHMSPSQTPPAQPIDPEWARESNTAMIVGVTGGFHALALLFVGLRVYTRVAVVKVVGRDDAVVVASVLCAVAGMTIFSVQAFYGLGKHTLTILEEDMVVMRRSSFFQSIISSIAGLALLKVSIGLSLLRLSRSAWYSRSLWALIAFVSAYSFMAWMTFFFFCQPLEGFWDKSLEPKCYPIALFIKFGLVNTAFNIFTDVCFATLPVSIIWTLQMKLRTRVYLIIVLSLGYFAVAMGIIKSVYQIAYGKDTDKTFYQSIQFWEL
ncbi:hypothetical protein CTA2_838, partial [Colletotrichum tanaceti]